MKNKTITLEGKQIFANQDELEEGYVEIIIEVKDILDEIDNEDIEDYARDYLDMNHEDDFESNLDDFDEDELADKLEDWGYNFSKQIGEDECIEFLEESGYTITADKDVDNSLDYIDASRLEEITNLFVNGSWHQRDLMYKLLIK
jgi:hypothetical protein